MPARRSKRRSIWWVIRLPVGRFASWGRGLTALTAVALYVYIVLTQPFAVDVIPSLSPVGSPIPRLASLWLERDAITASSRLPSGVYDQCGVVPVTSGIAAADGHRPLYGDVLESELPWSAEPPLRLLQLREEVDAKRLVAAFRTTLPDPLWDEEHNVGVAAAYLQGTIVRPGETLSLFRVIGPFTEARGYRDGPTYVGGRIVPTIAGGVCKIATTLYNAVVMGDLEVVERKPHSMRVPYVPPGRDAAISTGHKDVRFRNNRETPILLWAGMRGTTLFIAVYGQHEAPRIEWGYEELARTPKWEIRRPASDLPSGVERVAIEGYDGVTVRTWITLYRPGEPPVRKDLSVDTYLPLPTTIEYGP